jgi:hypothetical protein
MDEDFNYEVDLKRWLEWRIEAILTTQDGRLHAQPYLSAQQVLQEFEIVHEVDDAYPINLSL